MLQPPEGTYIQKKRQNIEQSSLFSSVSKHSIIIKMPTDPFQCQVLVWKAGFEQPVQCDFIVKEHASIKDQQVTYQNHIEIHKMNGSFLTNSSEKKADAHLTSKGSKMKVTSCPKWVRDQTFESFDRDFKDWQKCSDLTPEQEKGFLIEMLKSCEKEDVKHFYQKNIMNSKTVKHDVEGILTKLRGRFGRREREEWYTFIESFQDYKWDESESSEKTWDKLEELRLNFKKMDHRNDTDAQVAGEIEKKLDKLFLKMLLRSGEKQKKLDNAEIIKLEEKFEEDAFDWEKAKENFSKIIVEKESRKNVNETNYMDRRSRSKDNRYQSFNNRRYQSRSKSRESHRSSTPNKYHRGKSSDFDKPSLKELDKKVGIQGRKIDKI